MAKKESYLKIAQEAVDKGFSDFSTSARKIYMKNVEKFLNYYRIFYDNHFARNFEIIESIYIIQSKADFERIKTDINNILIKNTDKKKGIFNLYRILNRKKNLVRIGYSSRSAEGRLSRYLSKCFSASKKLNNFHLDVKALGDPNKFSDEFEYQILCISTNHRQIKALERLFTIYENRYDNDVGFDLLVNNYYNKIVGDLYDYIDGDLKDKKFHPGWKDIPPSKFETAFKKCRKWDCILSNFQSEKVKDKRIIKDRALSFGFITKGTGTLMDIRSYFMKPILEDAILRKKTSENIYNTLIDEGFIYLKKMSNLDGTRNERLRTLLLFIWGEDLEKFGFLNGNERINILAAVRKILIGIKVLSLLRSPRYNTIIKAQTELIKQGISLNTKTTSGYDELGRILCDLNIDYKEEQNKILASILETLLIQNDPELTMRDIAKKFGIFSKTADKLIYDIVIRIFRKFRGENISIIRNFLKNNKLCQS